VDFLEAREQFPALGQKIFLDAACVSLAPRAAVEAIQRFLEMAAGCPAPSSTQLHIAMDEIRAAARPEAAKLIGAHADEIALVESTTHGLTLAANAIPLERDDRVLICDLEYLQVAIPWSQKKQELGIAIDPVPNRLGRIEVEDIESRIRPRTKVICISSVQWNNGFRCDLDALASLCRGRRIWLVVDAIQQLGAVPLDVRSTPVDIVACGGHKWLNAPFGNGFLYIRREVLPRLRAPLAGYMSLEAPEGGWETYFQTPSITPFRDYRFVDKAWRFEVGGTAGYPAAVGLAASLKLINDLGPERIWSHILQLTDHLIDGLRTLGVTVVTPMEREHRSGIVTFSVGDAAKNIALMQRLLDRKILVSVRYTSQVGGVRVSCHFFNSLADLDTLLNAIEEHLT
jgi:selenocysteine lyase/cysteine desulfurase